MTSTRMKLLAALFLTLALSPTDASAPHNTVVTLGADNFEGAIKDSANPLWLLKFYAPWCGHCKKLAPVLDKVAPELEGKLAIGKIDCTVEKALCNGYSVRGYPTLKVALDGEILDYEGGRIGAAILSFAERMSTPSVKVVSSYDDALRLATEETEEGVAFLGYDPHDSIEEPSELKQLFYAVARKKQASAYFYWWVAEEVERDYPFVHRIEAGIQPKGWGQGTNKDENTPESFLAFVTEENVPTISTFGPANFNRVGKNGREIAMTVVDMENEAQVQAIKEHMLAYVEKTEEEVKQKYYFGVIDGKKYERFLEQFGVIPAENPQTLVLDYPTREYWRDSTYTNLFEFMKAKEEGVIAKQAASKSGRKGFLAKLENAFIQNMPYSLGLLLALVSLIVFLIVPSGEDLHPRSEDKGGKSEKDKDTEPKKDK